MKFMAAVENALHFFCVVAERGLSRFEVGHARENDWRSDAWCHNARLMIRLKICASHRGL